MRIQPMYEILGNSDDQYALIDSYELDPKKVTGLHLTDAKTSGKFIEARVRTDQERRFVFKLEDAISLSKAVVKAHQDNTELDYQIRSCFSTKFLLG